MIIQIDRREHPIMKKMVRRRAKHTTMADEQEVSLDWTPKEEDIVEIEETDLLVGDYVDKSGSVGIERKSDDFFPELQNGNLFGKLEELRQFPAHFLILDKSLADMIAEQTHHVIVPDNVPSHDADEYMLDVAINRTLGAIASCCRRGFVPILAGNKSFAAELIVMIMKKFHDGKDRTVMPVRLYSTMADDRVGILQRFPGIGQTKAKKLLKHFDTFSLCLDFLMAIDQIEVEEVRKYGLNAKDQKEIAALMASDPSKAVK